MKHTILTLIITGVLYVPITYTHAETNAELITRLLAQIEVLKTELAKLVATQGGGTTCTFTRTLKEGTEGTDVTCLQTYLKKKGHFTGTATGFYGPLTKAAVYTWQKSVGIVPEPTAIGMFGPRSQEVVVREMRGGTKNSTITTNIDSSNSETSITKKRNSGGGGGSSRPDKETLTDIEHDTKKPITAPASTIPRPTVTVPTVPKQSTTPSTAPAPTTSLAHWSVLCAQQGIFVCDDFSDASKLYGTRYSGTGNGASTPGISNGNLVFTIPTKSTGNVAGSYTLGFPSSIGQGQFLAFSYRIKADRNAIELNAPGRKEFILWRGSSSCTDLQVSISHQGYGSKYLVPYTECGATGFGYDLPTGDIQLHYPDYDCKYRTIRAGDTSKCALSNADAWDTYYIEMNIGTYGQPNSKVVMWQKVEGGTWKRFIDTNTFKFQGSGGFHNFMLTTYMTAKDGAIEHPTAVVKYDHLIMSTKPFNVDQFLNAIPAVPVAPVVQVQPTTSPVPVTIPTSGSVTLVDFGGSASTNVFGAVGWATVIKDTYTNNQDFGPGGMTITAGNNSAYNVQGVRGTARTFASGEKIVVTWYNNSANTITFTPRISLEDAGRYSSNSGGPWYSMTSVTIPARGTATSEYIVTSASAGSHALVNINTNYTSNSSSIAVADKITLVLGGSSVPSVPVSVPATVPTVPASVPPVTVPPPPISKINSKSFATQVSEITPGYWASIVADNKAEDVDPGKDPIANPNYPAEPPWRGSTGYPSVWGAWNSGAFASSYGSCGSILYFGGGHVDYFGNQVIALDLCGGTANGPIWKRLSNPYAGNLQFPYSTGGFPDGTPSPPHTYDGLAFDESNNSLFLINAQTTLGAAVSNNAWLFNLSTKRWSGPFDHRGSMEGTVAYDSKRKLIWFQPEQGRAGELTSLNTKTGAMSYYGWPYTYGLGNLDSMMGYDPNQDRLVLTTFRGESKLIAEKDLNNPSGPWKIATQVNTPASLNGQHAFAWSKLRGAWIVWNAYTGSAVYELKRTNVSALGIPEYTWTLLTSASNTVPPVPANASINGSYKKFQIVETAPGVEVLVGQLRPADGIKAFRVPAPGVVTRPTKVPLTSGGTKATIEDLLNQIKVLQAELNKLKH